MEQPINVSAAEILKRGMKEWASLMGRKGGQKGGEARAKALSAERKREIAAAAAAARWSKDHIAPMTHLKDYSPKTEEELLLLNKKTSQNMEQTNTLAPATTAGEVRKRKRASTITQFTEKQANALTKISFITKRKTRRNHILKFLKENPGINYKAAWSKVYWTERNRRNDESKFSKKNKPTKSSPRADNHHPLHHAFKNADTMVEDRISHIDEILDDEFRFNLDFQKRHLKTSFKSFSVNGNVLEVHF